MTGRRLARPAIAGMMLVAGAMTGVSPAQAPAFAAFGIVERGRWQLRESGGASRSVCVTDAAALFQLRSRGSTCTRFVIDNGASSATVHYTCPGAGHGRTTISVETPRLMRIESQGMDAGAPFSIEIEARRSGPCG